MKILAISILLSSLSSQAYELLNFSSSEPRTTEEILTESNLHRDELTLFGCDSDFREDLFAKTTIQNMALDSLKIQDGRRIYTYKSGNLYKRNGRKKRVRRGFLKEALDTLKDFEQVPETKQLIFELQASPYPLTIRKGGNRFSPDSETANRAGWFLNNATMVVNLDELKPGVTGLPFNQIGSGGRILWNPQTNASFIEEDGQSRKIDTRIILAHEMYHAYDAIRGLLDRRFVVSDKHEFQPVAEFRAVRLENILREAFGYKKRKYYADTEGAGMLDENGETIIMPTPCVKWL